MPSDANPAVTPDRLPERPVVFFERLWPSPGIWTATIAFGAALGLIPVPINIGIAVITGIVCVLGLIVLVLVTTPTVSVTGEDFIAGRARVPLDLIAAVEILDAEQVRQARGIGLDARAYLCLRGWLPVGVKVLLDDPEDPTPYWLVSSRRPEALKAAVSSRTAGAQKEN